ncbi:hypothetical protein B0H14DRAFT_2559074 [Mycena olivaceomarginata]|nr:hypothetical protein B0H14DRAFT_2559074 [Mycena olivaceomarginata]
MTLHITSPSRTSVGVISHMPVSQSHHRAHRPITSAAVGRRELAVKKLHLALKEEQDQATGTGLERSARWRAPAPGGRNAASGSALPGAGNSANAALAATGDRFPFLEVLALALPHIQNKRKAEGNWENCKLGGGGKKKIAHENSLGNPESQLRTIAIGVYAGDYVKIEIDKSKFFGNQRQFSRLKKKLEKRIYGYRTGIIEDGNPQKSTGQSPEKRTIEERSSEVLDRGIESFRLNTIETERAHLESGCNLSLRLNCDQTKFPSKQWSEYFAYEEGTVTGVRAHSSAI